MTVFLSSSWRKAITLPLYHVTSHVDNNMCVVCAHTQIIKYQSIIDVCVIRENSFFIGVSFLKEKRHPLPSDLVN
jgi:hypothetical protein